MNPSDQDNNSLKGVFEALPPVKASPYLAGRVLALHRERQKHSRTLWLWRLIATVSMAALVGVVIYQKTQAKAETLFAFQPYVIHVNLDEPEMKVAASAEVELPAGVTFVSKNQEVQALRRMKLQVAVGQGQDGRSRLPFVVRSDREGTLPLQVRIFDAQDHLLETKTLTLHFVRPS